ncbi:MAG: hypothetical protein INR68_00840 [Methylobacterium mesophilicum]|nr:hypothetical protein [Methylobacterium mesophilicum]
MNSYADNDRESLKTGIRRQMGAETTTRFLRSLPLFRTVETLPDHFRDMLAKLDEQERHAVGGKR